MAFILYLSTHRDKVTETRLSLWPLWAAKQCLGIHRQSYSLTGSTNTLYGQKYILRCGKLVESDERDVCVSMWPMWWAEQSKQRNWEYTDKVALWWDRPTHFLDSGHGPGIRRAKGNQILVNLDWKRSIDINLNRTAADIEQHTLGTGVGKSLCSW